MPIHEKSLIRSENLRTHEQLVVDGVDVSGHWSTFIQSRVVQDYNEALQEQIAALPGGEHIHRCWQCGSCTNACTVNALNPDFNPRFWIYLVRMGLQSELLRDKDIIWKCVSCNKCTYACPRDVNPEGVMKALNSWLELQGHTPKSSSTVFDEVFAEQVFERGRIEEGRVIQRFFKRTGQALRQDWLVEMARRLVRHMPVGLLMRMGLSGLLAPRARGWSGARAALREYTARQEARHREVLGLEREGAGPAAAAPADRRDQERQHG